MSRLKIIFALLCIFVLTTCKKENDRPQWDVGVLGPLVKGSLGLSNLINDTLIKVNPADSTVTIVYNKSFYSLNIDSLVSIPDTTVTTYMFNPFPVTEPLSAGSPFPVPSGQTNLAINNVQLRWAIVKSGKAQLRAVNHLPTKVYFTYQIPKATNNGIPFNISDSVAAALPNDSAVVDSIYDLSGYDLDLTGTSGNSVNSIAYTIHANTDPNGPNLNVAPHDTFMTISNTFLQMIPYYAKGYLGQTSLTIADSSAFSLFNSIKSGTLNLAAASMKLTIENDMGMDARIVVSKIQSLNTNNHDTVDLAAPSIINQTLNINRAEASGTNTSPSYIPSFYPIQIDNSNSNFKSLLNNLPDFLTYNIKIQTNPLGNVSGDNDFAFADHLVNATIDLQIPLNLSTGNLLFSDTANFSLAGDSTLNNLGSGTFTFNVYNGFPFAVNITLVTIDSLNNFLDMLVSNGLAAAPPLDINNRVISKQLSQFIIPVDEARMDRLRRAKRMVVTAVFTSAAPGNQQVKIYSDYTLDFKLIANLIYHVR